MSDAAERPAAAAHLVEVAGHQPRQHLFGDARQACRSARPASLAALRAAVWESDWIVGASTTSAAAIAAATASRRLGGGGFALGDHRQRRVGAVALRLDPHQRPDLFGHGIADDQHLLARRDAHALADDRPHRPVQLCAHPRAHPSLRVVVMPVPHRPALNQISPTSTTRSR